MSVRRAGVLCSGTGALTCSAGGTSLAGTGLTINVAANSALGAVTGTGALSLSAAGVTVTATTFAAGTLTLSGALSASGAISVTAACSSPTGSSSITTTQAYVHLLTHCLLLRCFGARVALRWHTRTRGTTEPRAPAKQPHEHA